MNRAANVAEYLAAVESGVAKSTLEELRSAIRSVLPDAEEIINYGMPCFKVGKPIVWYAAFKNHCSLFAGYTISEFADRLTGYEISKGTVQFSHGSALPVDLIREIVQARLAEVQAKKA